MLCHKRAFLTRAGLVFIGLCCLAASGCGDYSTWKGVMPTHSRQDLPYLQAEPYTRLFIEVDTIGDVDIPEGCFDQLKEFLAKYCDKPDGIIIRQDEPIAPEVVTEFPLHAIANLHLDGIPAELDDGKTAYLQILVFDTRRLDRKPFRPRVKLPYTTIYLDMGWRPIPLYWHPGMFTNILKHEAGHVLGLSKNPEHTKGGAHCTNDGCLMNIVIFPVSRSLLRIAPRTQDLCEDCRQDLQEAKRQPTTDHMGFVGPFLTRREQDYTLNSLPAYSRVRFIDADVFDWHEALGEAKANIREHLASPTQRAGYIQGTASDLDADSPDRIIRFYAAVVHALSDPDPNVRKAAKEIVKDYEANAGINSDSGEEVTAAQEATP